MAFASSACAQLAQIAFSAPLFAEGSRGRAPLLSTSGKNLVEQNVFIVLIDHEAVGGGFFFQPGKAVTADHNLPPSYRSVCKGAPALYTNLKKEINTFVLGAERELMLLCALRRS